MCLVTRMSDFYAKEFEQVLNCIPSEISGHGSSAIRPPGARGDVDITRRFLDTTGQWVMAVITRGGAATAAGAPSLRGSSTVLTWVLPHLIAYVAARGYDPRPLTGIRGLQGKDLDDPDTRVADAVAAEVWNLAEAITGDDVLGLHMAEAIPAGALDLLEYAFRASPTLGSGLDQVARYGRVVSDRAASRLQQVGNVLEITWDVALQPQRTECAVAFLLRLARDVTGAPLVPIEVRFNHAAPESKYEHRVFFRAPVRFDGAVNQLLLHQSDMARPLRGADPALLGVVRRRLEKMLRQIPTDHSVAGQAARALLEIIPRGQPTALTVAREIGMSERTLHRHLLAEGTSFRKILDSVRSQLAASFLREPHVGTDEVAYLLGYSERAAFHRAFRRWTGKTPLNFRRSLREQTPVPSM